jgi:hypothetical protein
MEILADVQGGLASPMYEEHMTEKKNRMARRDSGQ